MNANKIQETIRKSRQAGVSTPQIEWMLAGHPYLLTYSEIQEALAKAGTYNSTFPPGPTGAIYEGIKTEHVNSGINVQPTKQNHTPSKLNRAAVKQFALEVSETKKNGKFERVGSEFLKWVEAELENTIQGICRNSHSEDDLASNYDFLNWKQVGPRVREVLNRAVRRAIFARVKNHPSTGKTLK